VWLTSNAKTLVNLVPGYPLINALAASILFVCLSQELYRLTMSLRGMLLPDHDVQACMRSLLGIGVIVGAYTAVGAVLCGDWDVVGWLKSSDFGSGDNSDGYGERGAFVLLPPPYSVNGAFGSSSSSSSSSSGGWRTPFVVASIAVGAAYGVLTLVQKAIEAADAEERNVVTQSLNDLDSNRNNKSSDGGIVISKSVSPTAAGTSALATNNALEESSSGNSNRSGDSSGDSSNSSSSRGSSGRRYNNDKDDSSKSAARAWITADGKRSIDLRPSCLLLSAVWLALLPVLRGFSAYVSAHPTRSTGRFLPPVVLSRPMPVPQSRMPLPVIRTVASMLPVLGSSNRREGSMSPLECVMAASNGQWVDLNDQPTSPAYEEVGSNVAASKMVAAPAYAWQWPDDDSGCDFGKLPVAAAQALLAGGNVVIIGDSVARCVRIAC
jgi:hypothetical protein